MKTLQGFQNLNTLSKCIDENWREILWKKIWKIAKNNSKNTNILNTAFSSFLKSNHAYVNWRHETLELKPPADVRTAARVKGGVILFIFHSLFFSLASNVSPFSSLLMQFEPASKSLNRRLFVQKHLWENSLLIYCELSVLVHCT